MDPNAALARLLDLLCRNNARNYQTRWNAHGVEQAQDTLDDLLNWLSAGGAAPRDPRRSQTN